MLLAAQQSQLRHLRRLKQLKRQAELAAAAEAAWEAKQGRSAERQAARQQEAAELQVGGLRGWPAEGTVRGLCQAKGHQLRQQAGGARLRPLLPTPPAPHTCTAGPACCARNLG